MENDRLFENKYGYFANSGKEYVITTPKTPRPWANIISNGDYAFMVSQTGGGYSWRGNSVENRITRSYQDVIKDNWGKYIYLRDDKSKEFWSAAWKPVCKNSEEYKVIHGVGYSTIEQKYNNIKTALTMYAVPDAPMEIWKLKITNEAKEERELSLMTYFEWCLGTSPDEHREFHKIFTDNEYVDDINGFLTTKCLWLLPNKNGQNNNRDWEYAAFHTCSEKPFSYDGDKESFIGLYGSEENPQAMNKEELDRNTGRYYDSVASLHVKVKLQPGKSKEIVFTLGAADDRKQAIELAKRYIRPEEAENALRRVHEFWKPFIESEKAATPDEALNIMTNIWLKYQAISCRLWGKSAYYQVSGGYGYRDQLQDCQIFLTSVPEYTRKQIMLHAGKQKSDGTVYHWWMTISGKGPETRCSDDLLWLPFITASYLKETNDFSILNETAPYFDTNEEVNLYEHCKCAIEKVFTRFSERGIPLIGENDWNDGLSAVGWNWKGESFWLGEFLYIVLDDFKEISKKAGNIEFAKKCSNKMKDLKKALNDYGWNGEWYIQATTDSGEEIGAKGSEEGFIYLNPQVWAVLSGIADPKRAETAMDSVTKYLFKDYGTLLLYPAHSKVREDIGYITRYAPGLRENGGVYSHAAAWAVEGYVKMGQIERAYELYRRICPPNRSLDIDHYKGEPFVMPGNSDGPQSPNYGRGSWTWYTGSAQWLQRIATNWILGVRADYDGLIIDPAIPQKWDGFTFVRKFRNTIYNIVVDNSAHVNRGVREIYLDGKVVEGNKLTDLNDGNKHEVKVIMG